jgi:hypothetical protein
VFIGYPLVPLRPKTQGAVPLVVRDDMTTGETPNGYRLEVACPCGVMFERWITPREATEDLAILARLN